MYVVGFSGGGNATGYIAEDVPELIAGFAPSTGVMLQTTTAQELARTAEHQPGLFLGYGTMDAEGRWPISEALKELGPVSNPAPISVRLDNTNAWIRAAGATSELTSTEEIGELTASEPTTASSLFGLNFDRNFSQSLETTYYFGEYLNGAGQPVARFMAVEGNPHYMSPSWAQESIQFLSRFSRDPKTNELMIQDF